MELMFQKGTIKRSTVDMGLKVIRGGTVHRRLSSVLKY
jgi:hypothetical protein